MGGVTRTQYDKVGNTIAVTDPLSRTTRYSFDNRDRQTTITSPLNAITRTTYDRVGNVLAPLCL